jgi:hypothetical protein
MKFFNNRIFTKPVSLEEAAAKAKSASATKALSLDELLARIDAENKQVKAAASDKQVKTAQTMMNTTDLANPAPVAAQAPVAEAFPPKAEAVDPVTGEPVDPLAKPVAEAVPPSATALNPDALAQEGIEIVDDPMAPPVLDENPETSAIPIAPSDAELPLAAAAGAKGKSIKVAKSLDLRAWSREDVIKAWSQHGGFDKCVANVSGKTSDPKAYCGLLQVASAESERLIKEAAAEKAKQTKAASAEPKQQRVAFKKLAKLTDKERGALSKYWAKLYGQDYVDAMLEDY